MGGTLLSSASSDLAPESPSALAAADQNNGYFAGAGTGVSGAKAAA